MTCFPSPPNAVARLLRKWAAAHRDFYITFGISKDPKWNMSGKCRPMRQRAAASVSHDGKGVGSCPPAFLPFRPRMFPCWFPPFGSLSFVNKGPGRCVVSMPADLRDNFWRDRWFGFWVCGRSKNLDPRERLLAWYVFN